MSSFRDLEEAKARNSLVQHVLVGSAGTPSVFKQLLYKLNNVYARLGRFVEFCGSAVLT